MKVIHLNALDVAGGAGIAAGRLHNAMLSRGVDSQYWVYEKLGDMDASESVYPEFLRRYGTGRSFVVNKLVDLACNAPGEYRSINILPSGVHLKINKSDADLVNLHWINGEMLSIPEIAKIDKPIVWTLHDMWPFLGADHYTVGPVSQVARALDRSVFNRKSKHWRGLHVRFVAPSNWIARELKSSKLFRKPVVSVIPNTIDLTRYRKLDKQTARATLGITDRRFVLMFAASGSSPDPRKGIDLLREAIANLDSLGVDKDVLGLLVVGDPSHDVFERLPIKTTLAGKVKSQDEMNLYYSAADLLALPSRVDNFPNTMVEAMASGTPCISFDTGGMEDLIQHKQNGYLVRSYDTRAYATGIFWFVKRSAAQQDALSKAARSTVAKTCDPDKIVESYLSVYRSAMMS